MPISLILQRLSLMSFFKISLNRNSSRYSKLIKLWYYTRCTTGVVEPGVVALGVVQSSLDFVYES